MAMAKMVFTLEDTAGNEGTAGFFFPEESNPGDATALKSALQGVSDAAVVLIVATDVVEGDVGAIATAAHNDIEDKAVVYGHGEGGESMKLTIPAPKPELFIAGTRMVDISAGAGLALKNAIQTAWKTTNGGAVTVERIQRERVKKHKL